MVYIGAILAFFGLVVPAVVVLVAFALLVPAVPGLYAIGILPSENTSRWPIYLGISIGLSAAVPVVGWCRASVVRWDRHWLQPTLVVVALVLLVIEMAGLADFNNMILHCGIVAAYIVWATVVLWAVFGPGLRWLRDAWRRATREMRGGLNPRVGLLGGAAMLSLLGIAVPEVVNEVALFRAASASDAALVASAKAIQEGQNTARVGALGIPQDEARASAMAARFPASRALPPELHAVRDVVLALSDARRLSEHGELQPRAALVEYRRLAEAVAWHLSEANVEVEAPVLSMLPPLESYQQVGIGAVPEGDLGTQWGQFRAIFGKSCRGWMRCSAPRPTYGITLLCWPFFVAVANRASMAARRVRRATMREVALWPKLLLLLRAGNSGAHFASDAPEDTFEDLDTLANDVLAGMVAAYR